ncbi:MAG TPA: GAF domain-containing protein [Elusimicrobiales bacterium]|nr:GAF domain-containing protein [Elusimicrobiales bacterium]
MTPLKRPPIPDIALLKWRNIADLLAEVAGVPSASINMLEGDQLRVIGVSKGPDNPVGEGSLIKTGEDSRSYCSAVIQARERLVVQDARRSAYWKNGEMVKAGFISYAGVPVFHPDGDIFGSICLFDRKTNDFQGPVLRLMEEFADIITGHLSLIAKNAQLEETLKEVRTLQGLIPICANCKKIRDDKGFWQRVEVYLEQRSAARFTHGLCDACADKLYGKESWYKDVKKPGKGE